jgi:hypothetical protein
VFPICFNKAISDDNACEVFYHLVYEILICHSKLFFSSNVISKISESRNEEQLKGLLMTIASSFRKSNLEIIRLNLHYLDSLHNKINLFSRETFKSQLLYGFLDDFITILIRKSHDLLRDEIISLCWKLISVDESYFKNIFIQKFCTDHSMNENQIILFRNCLNPINVSF